MRWYPVLSKKRLNKIFMCFILQIPITVNVFAITCTQSDWDPGLCSFPIAKSERCVDPNFFRTFCHRDTDGCRDIPLGCIGFTPPGHWYPVSEDGIAKRCRCGCFGSETMFLASDGSLIKGSYLIQLQKKNLELMTINQLSHFDRDNFAVLDTGVFTATEITGLMYGPEKSGYHIKTRSGREIWLSDGHPVVTSNHKGEISSIKQAKNVSTEDFLVLADGARDKVIQNSLQSYHDQMLNFTIKSDNPNHHFVIANDFLMGDHSWQEQLNNSGSRIYFRSDIFKYIHQRNIYNQKK